MKKIGRKSIKDRTQAELERDLERTAKALSNKKLLPQSKRFYGRRQEMTKAEMARRSYAARTPQGAP